eukprot:TRINITY_DN13170_c0_g1_i1.p1 TRINITY_DN13170_c0_g1~~TRINITY_DN13170_c0_g1_i1.p1  ORF type:complete len:295 (-),score=31.38 TRINITY_DN13170_c0_g1_i1:114-941(-)
MMAFGTIVYCLCECGKKYNQQRVAIPDSATFLMNTRTECRGLGNTVVFPSGAWRGFYQQYGQSWSVADFTFEFDIPRGCLQGGGVDQVGEYSVTGIFAEDGSGISFTKAYIRGSRAVNGFTNHRENRGHCVEYRGKRVGASLGQGFKGNWYVDIPGGYSGSGAFHLWPSSLSWRQDEQTNLAAGAVGIGSHGSAGSRPVAMTFTVNDDHTCVVCFDRSIDVCLVPCGHIAVCQICAGRLQPRLCPICRTHVTELAGPDGQTLREQTFHTRYHGEV